MIEKKNAIQQEALNNISKNLGGTIAMATGTGKSRVFILACAQAIAKNPEASLCLVVPTEKLRDENWHEEFKKWGYEDIYTNNLDRYCYASISKSDVKYDLIGADEVHNITENNSVFFENNKGAVIIGMTATPPEEQLKKELLNKYCPIVFTYTLHQGIEDGIILPFKIKVVETQLDASDKYIIAGSKKKQFNTTEYDHYQYLTKQINVARYARNTKLEQFRTFQRMRFLYNLKSKTEAAEFIRDHYLKDKKSIIFCGSIAQAETLCENSFHSKSKDKPLEDFIHGKINMLSCVKALNEGINIPYLDAALIVQSSSKKREIIQRIGRCVRWREDAEATIYIISTINTQDQVWTTKAIEEFPEATIEYIHFKNLKR